MAENVLSFDDALQVVLTHAHRLVQTSPPESVALLDSAYRTLAAPVFADRDQPPFPRSTRDGFALRAEDAAAPLRVIGSLRAGQAWARPPLQPGEAIEIMTGAPIPPGANSVVMVEHTKLAGNSLSVAADRSLRPAENIVPQGAEAAAGATLLSAGTLINAAEIAVAASCGLSDLQVFAKPRVAIVATGDELVELDDPIAPSQIRNSNSYALAALVSAEGGIPARLATARDTLSDVRARIAEGRAADLLVLSGGVSMGKFDLVEQVLAEFHAEFFFTGALIQPGKPVVFGRLPPTPTGPACYFFGLPGNPISTQVTFALFVAPLLRALSGRTAITPTFAEARLAADVTGGARVTRFLPALLEGTIHQAEVHIVPWQGSGDLAANARANCYAVLPAGGANFRAGDTVRVLLR